MNLILILLALLKVTTSMKTALKSSNDEEQYAVCYKSHKSMNDYEVIKQSSADMGMIRRRLVNYCELQGTFVFYSVENFQGEIKYGDKDVGRNEGEYISEMDPEDQRVSMVRSVRIVGKLEKWNANTLTFYAEPNFRGATEKMLVEDDFGTEYLPFEPKSAIVTGPEYWTVYDENNRCRIMTPYDTEIGEPNFYLSFNGQNPQSINMNIKKAKIGCHCNNDPEVPCSPDSF